MITNFKNIIQKTLLKFGYRISKVDQSEKKFSIYKYKNYTEYKDTQVYYNKLKISHVWADELNLKLISEYIFNHSNQKKLIGICHGSRNGYEQKKFKELIKDQLFLGLIFQKPLKIMKIVLFGTFMMPKKMGK